jgi:hypothetical protein
MSKIYRKPIQVICNSDSSTKLIKGAQYIAISINTTTCNNKINRTIYIKDVGGFVLKNFTNIDGSSLDNEPDFSIQTDNRLIDTKDYTGQFIKCIYSYSSCKSLKGNEIYFVEKQINTPSSRGRYDIKLKIRGIKNLVNSYKFREIDISEQRKIKLNNIKGNITKTGEQTRKFLLYTEKEKTIILFETLTKVLVDINNIHDGSVNITDFMIKKGKNYCLIEDDIKEFLKTTILDSLKPFNNLIK